MATVTYEKLKVSTLGEISSLLRLQVKSSSYGGMTYREFRSFIFEGLHQSYLKDLARNSPVSQNVNDLEVKGFEGDFSNLELSENESLISFENVRTTSLRSLLMSSRGKGSKEVEAVAPQPVKSRFGAFNTLEGIIGSGSSGVESVKTPSVEESSPTSKPVGAGEGYILDPSSLPRVGVEDFSFDLESEDTIPYSVLVQSLEDEWNEEGVVEDTDFWGSNEDEVSEVFEGGGISYPSSVDTSNVSVEEGYTLNPGSLPRSEVAGVTSDGFDFYGEELDGNIISLDDSENEESVWLSDENEEDVSWPSDNEEESTVWPNNNDEESTVWPSSAGDGEAWPSSEEESEPSWPNGEDSAWPEVSSEDDSSTDGFEVPDISFEEDIWGGNSSSGGIQSYETPTTSVPRVEPVVPADNLKEVRLGREIPSESYGFSGNPPQNGVQPSSGVSPQKELDFGSIFSTLESQESSAVARLVEVTSGVATPRVVKTTNSGEAIFERGMTLREFVRKNPKCTMELAEKYFSKADISKYLRIGKIVKKGNLLFT